MQKISGSCGCGAVSYTAEGNIDGVVSCHCKLCQRLHGNYNPMVIVERTDFTLRTSDALEWYDSSAEARRGFCRLCGAALFKEQKTGPKILIAVGSLDNTDGWTNIKNVFIEEAGHYYTMPGEAA